MSPSYLFILFIASCAFLSIANGDVYMQNPRGNNDRLNENGDRNNANRLFNSENNARGGYCWSPSSELSYYEGSVLSVEWTNQHACGVDNSQCNIVMQYMCSDDGPNADPTQIIRDGTTTNTIPTGTDPNGGQNYYNVKDTAGTGTAFLFGMNEPIANYRSCVTRSRNKGLFTADQTVSNNQGAMATRQNPTGTRYGFECTEEKDYYPYWHPSTWKDVAVLVPDTAQCGYYQGESQNVKSKNYCTGNANALTKNNERECTEAAGTWATKAAWGIDKPACVQAPLNRDNHLGNGVAGTTNSFNWTLPRAAQEACVTGGSCACVMRLRYNISVGDYDPTVDSTDSGANTPVKNDETVAVSGYNFTLALNTAQTGRTFQDRSYMFRIIPRPDGVSKTDTIYNLNVRGKRGNIVQTYPATEYDFVPTNLEVAKDDLIHFQWTGCDNNPAGNAGEGKTSTDRSNIVQIADLTKNYPMSDEEVANGNALFRDPTVRARMANIDQVNCKNYSQLLKDNNNNQNAIEQDNGNCQKLNAAPPRFKGGLVRMENTGTYYYMSTRNNNFSNRSQKASIHVRDTWPAWKTAVIVVAGVVAVSVGAAAGTIFYAKRNPHSRVAEFVSKIPGINRI